jgi:hypothetical protein
MADERRKSTEFNEVTAPDLTANIFTGNETTGRWRRSTIAEFFANLGITVTIDGTSTGFAGIINYTSGDVTISSGAITIANTIVVVDTESAAASDDLDTISGSVGDLLILRTESAARVVTAKDGTGNLQLNGDFVMDSIRDVLTLVRVGSFWLEVSRSDNA